MAVYCNDTPDKFKRAFQSVINQESLGDTKVNLYLGIDGPISDALQNAISEVRNEIFHLSAFEENRGVAPVVNDIVQLLANEPYIFRMDADDESYLTRFRKQIDFMSSNPQIDILGTAITERQESVINRLIRFPKLHDEAVNNLYWRVPIANPTVCFRRRVLIDTGGYPVQNLSEDVAMWFHCALRGYRFANLDEPLLYFTIDRDFWSRRSAKRAWREYLVWSKGVWLLHGASWKLMAPLVRLGFRLCPEFIRKAAYGSNIRRV